ncbi:MAG: cytochrome c-type biogenesis protein CcmH [Marinicaulis sp.]|nr:cytochrome c-type biogenesis protein CcmH [Marinicaulis sp.]NNL90199.1 cytochrome c-type biogenesis protein CcmH [Marinicaulis sp.]
MREQALARSLRIFLATLILSMGAAPIVGAVEPDEVLEDEALEERARALSRQLRCVVCQSQNIDDSNAPLAKDMRILLRERLMAGDSDEEIIEFLVDRYGDYILLKPPVQQNTILLWAAPFIIFLIAGAGAGAYLIAMKKRNRDEPDDKAGNEAT